MPNFAQWVREQRLARGFSTSECAERAGVKQPVWSEYESEANSGQPRRSRVEKVALGLQMPIDEVLVAAGLLPRSDQPSLSPEVLEFSRLLNSLPAAKRAAMVRLVRSSYEALSTV